jgi:hypothetical protein
MDAFLEHFRYLAVAEDLFESTQVAEVAGFGAVNFRNRLVRNHRHFRPFMTVRAGNDRMRTQPLLPIFGLNEKHMGSVVGMVEKTEPTVLMTEQTVIRIVPLSGRRGGPYEH